MRTLKKALSLVLVLAMVFALAVPGFAADTTKKASDFKDYSKVTNKEAVDVLTAIGVINGNADGTFNPEGSFTRAEAATLITYLTLGKTVADALPTSATKFSDVPATHWAAKYVQYCADAGIVNGVGNGKFDPDAKLTATQWALMLLGALGYNAKNEGIGGAGWEIATTKLAMKTGVASASELTGTFNRDMAAKFALNTLKATTVEYKTNGTNITIGDTTISTGASAATAVETASDNGNIKNDGKVQFAEQHFPKLELADSNGHDTMGRPATVWKLDSKEISTGAKTAAYSFVAAKNYDVTDATKMGTALNAALKITKDADKLTFADNKDFYVNGDKKTTTGTYTAAIKAGDVVEVFVGADKKTVTNVTVTNYAVAKVAAIRDLSASQIKANANSNDADVVAATKSIALSGGLGTIYNTKFAGFDYKVGDTVLVAKEDGAAVVLASKATTTVSGVVTKVTATTATVAGTDYTVADTQYKTESGNRVIDVVAAKDSQTFVVADGFIWGTSTTVSKDYVMVIAKTGERNDTGFDADKYYSVKYVDQTGAVAVVKSKSEVAAEGWYAISDDTTNTGMKVFGNVSGTTEKNLQGNKLTNTQPVIADGVIANASTVFVLKTGTNTYKTYTGIANVPSYEAKTGETMKGYAVVDGGYAAVVYIDTTSTANAAGTTAKDVIYVLSTTVAGTGYDVDKNVNYKLYDAIVNGEKTTVKVNNTYSIANAGLNVVNGYDGNGFINDVSKVENSTAGYAVVATSGNKAVSFSAPALTIEGDASYFVADDAVVYMIDANNSVTTVGAADLVGTANGTFYIVYKATNNNTVTAIYFAGTITA